LPHPPSLSPFPVNVLVAVIVTQVVVVALVEVGWRRTRHSPVPIGGHTTQLAPYCLLSLCEWGDAEVGWWWQDQTQGEPSTLAPSI